MPDAAKRACTSTRTARRSSRTSSTQGQFELEPEVVAFLAAKLDYRVGTIDAKLKVDKIIDGRITYLRLAGGLDNTFPREKLAEGLEGTVIVDVAGVSRVEPAGAAEWRSFVQQVTPLVETIYLTGVDAGVPREAVRHRGPRDQDAGRRLHAAVRVQGTAVRRARARSMSPSTARC